MKKILVDVDLTVVESDLAWLKYCQALYTKHYGKVKLIDWNSQGKGKINYDLGTYFEELGDKVYGFWSQDNLYDELVPMKNSVEVLKGLHDTGEWEILFASYCKKGHFGCKYDWLKKHFPFMDGFFATKEKTLY